MLARKRLIELEHDLDITVELFKATKSQASKQAINKLRYLLIKEQNKFYNYGVDDWNEL